MDYQFKIIILSIFIFILMNYFNVFSLIDQTMVGYDKKIIYGIKPLSLLSISYFLINNIHYYNNTIEGISNQSIELNNFVKKIRLMIYDFYDCSDLNSLRCKILFLEEKLSNDIIEDEIKEEITDVLRRYKKKEGDVIFSLDGTTKRFYCICNYFNK